jgi:hypothetical protein
VIPGQNWNVRKATIAEPDLLAISRALGETGTDVQQPGECGHCHRQGQVERRIGGRQSEGVSANLTPEACPRPRKQHKCLKKDGYINLAHPLLSILQPRNSAQQTTNRGLTYEIFSLVRGSRNVGCSCLGHSSLCHSD